MMQNDSFFDLSKLIERGIVDKTQINLAKNYIANSDMNLVEALIKLGFISHDVLDKFFEKEKINESQEEEHEPLERRYNIDYNLLKTIPLDFAKQNHVIPVEKRDGDLYVLIGDEKNIVAKDFVIKYFDKDNVIFVKAKKDEIILILNRAINFDFDLSVLIKQMSDFISQEHDKFSNESDEVAPFVKFLNSVLQMSFLEGASDIHFEPDIEFLRIRIRKDGVMKNFAIIDIEMWKYVLGRIKIISSLDITNNRTPQDGSISFSLDRRKIDIRVSTLPSIYGECVTMRLLDQDKSIISLKESSIRSDIMKKIDTLLNSSQGIFIVTGPTGSGKTTTLYAILNELKSIEKNIITLEDPVEYKIPLIRQVNVNDKAGLTFASGLRAILRQDPDIILLGEIRDHETADIAIKASITGHKVFSTLHTNSSVSAITRLIDMSVSKELITTAVKGIISQRLCRKLCDACKVPDNIEIMNYIISIFNSKSSSIKRKGVFKASGCKKCNYTGYSGRFPIYEIILLSTAIIDVINSNSNFISSSAIESEARKDQNFKTMEEYAFFEILLGKTSLREACDSVDIVNRYPDVIQFLNQEEM